MSADAAAIETVPIDAVEARVDKLTQALLYVAGELWAARDRQAVLERVLAEKNIDATALIDAYRPDETLAKTLESERETFVSTTLGYLAPEG